MTFEELNLNSNLIEALGYMGFKEATPIQEQAIPYIIDKRDLIACAQTGTGKTAAFILPVLNMLAESKREGISVLVICPTRELAIQIDEQVQAFAYFAGIESIPVYGGGGGKDWDVQKQAIINGVDIIVATPGKLIAHINMGYVDFSHLEYLILDEADRMLDMGFIDDIKRIAKKLPKKRQNLMFSATMAPKIRKLAADMLTDPAEISIALAKPAEGVLQAAYVCHNDQKIGLLHHLIHGKDNYKTILVFSSTKMNVTKIVNQLRRKGHDVAGISSDLDQSEREQVLQKYKAKRIRTLVATDVMSRGIDIKDINLVINFDVPRDSADYVHRVGRTARADTTGVAITFINEDDMYKFAAIEKLIDRELAKSALPAFLGEGPEWNPGKSRQRGHGGRGGNFRGKKKSGRNSNRNHSKRR